MIEIETKRLLLRPMVPADVEPHIQMMQNEEVAANLTDTGKVRDRGTEWRAAASMLGHWQIREFGFFSVFEKQSGAWVGRVGPWQPEGWPALEVGWGISHDHWGKGYAPEAALASIHWVFQEFPKLDKVISVIEPNNHNSQAVAKKVGEHKSTEKFSLWQFKLDIWKVDRQDWYAKFGAQF